MSHIPPSLDKKLLRFMLDDPELVITDPQSLLSTAPTQDENGITFSLKSGIAANTAALGIALAVPARSLSGVRLEAPFNNLMSGFTVHTPPANGSDVWCATGFGSTSDMSGSFLGGGMHWDDVANPEARNFSDSAGPTDLSPNADTDGCMVSVALTHYGTVRAWRSYRAQYCLHGPDGVSTVTGGGGFISNATTLEEPWFLVMVGCSTALAAPESLVVRPWTKNGDNFSSVYLPAGLR